LKCWLTMHALILGHFINGQRKRLIDICYDINGMCKCSTYTCKQETMLNVLSHIISCIDIVRLKKTTATVHVLYVGKCVVFQHLDARMYCYDHVMAL